MVSLTHIRRSCICTTSIWALACLLLLCVPLVAHAQSISTNISSQEITTHDVLVYSVEAEGAVKGVDPSFSKDFTVVGQSTQTSISFINGQTTRKLTASFQLAPNTPGTLRTGSATIRFKNGQTSHAKSYTIRVQDAGAAPRTSRTPPPQPPTHAPSWLPSPPPPPQTLAAKAFGEYPVLPLPGSEALHTQTDWQPPKDRPFVLPFINKEHVVVGEPFLVEYLYMEPLTALGFEALDMDEPEFPNAWFQDISELRLSTSPSRMRLRYGGAYYNAQIIRSYMVVPLREGSVSIAPLGLTLAGHTLTQRLEPFRITSPELTLIVTTPPPHKGETLSSPNVGRYHFNADLREETARVGDTVHLDLSIHGLGVPAHVRFPNVVLPQELQTLSAPETQRVSTSTAGWLETKKNQTLSFQPTQEGDFDIPPISFQWFDPWDSTWKHAETKAWTLHVKGHAPQASAPPTPAQKDTNIPSSWLTELPTGEHISEHQGLIERMRQYNEPWHGNPWYFFLLSIPIGSFLGLLALENLAHRRQRSRTVRRSNSAARQARRALKKCPPSDLESFSRMDQVMRKYLFARGIEGTRGATYQELRNALLPTRTAQHVDSLISHLQALEEARYGGADPVRFHALRNHLLAWLERDTQEDA